jgi:hypothetical protein
VAVVLNGDSTLAFNLNFLSCLSLRRSHELKYVHKICTCIFLYIQLNCSVDEILSIKI